MYVRAVLRVFPSSSVQIEKAFQKQQGVSQAKAGLLSKKKDGTVRYYKSIGLGYRTPKEAIEGTYVDKKCPFTSSVSIRGRILKGTAHTAQHTASSMQQQSGSLSLSSYSRCLLYTSPSPRD